MDNDTDPVGARISPRDAVTETAQILWHLRGILAILLLLFLFCRLRCTWLEARSMQARERVHR
ncbi:hypothetical protein VSR68_07450 [Paraburkholderia phymatum]|uniref:hypothetical protein n=1 Tax=Paraburkholderia phymatum TaxID=148447 RepID=UPI00317C99B5